MKKLITIISIVISTTSVALAKPEASHNIDQFNEILTGKVFLKDTPLWDEGKNVSSAIYLATDGSNFQCNYSKTKKNPTIKHRAFQNIKEVKWRVTKPFFSSGVLLTTNNNSTRSIPIYDENTNVLERWSKRKNEWKMLSVGHLQDSWPAWALVKCPDLKLPASLKINQKQTTPDYQQNYETYDLTPSGNKIVPVTFKEAEAFFQQNRGNILVDSDGKNYVPNLTSREFWKIDEKLEISDVAHLSLSKSTLDMQWAKLGAIQHYTFGDKIQLRPTGGRHPAFTFTDWLQKQGPVPMNLQENRSGTFEFISASKVVGYANGKNIQGTWAHTGDNITLSFTFSKSTPTIYSLTWREIASQVNWPGLQ